LQCIRATRVNGKKEILFLWYTLNREARYYLFRQASYKAAEEMKQQNSSYNRGKYKQYDFNNLP
jgi:hypothetical protein